MKEVKIIKATGEVSIFDVSKLITSLKRSGASDELALQIATDIEASLYEGMSTKEIYKKAFALLKKHSRVTAARYKLKKAILELGTSGFPFERYVAALLDSQGFKTEVGVIVDGQCVSHEIDVIAHKGDLHYICECKFHNRQNRTCNVKIPLYIHSRFKDVEQSLRSSKGHRNKFHQGWIFTNTRFTSDAMKYGNCVGLKLVGWDYPKGQGIKDLTDRAGIHPITCLTTLTSREKKALLELEIVHVKNLCNQPAVLDKIGMSKNRQKNILSEATQLCEIE